MNGVFKKVTAALSATAIAFSTISPVVGVSAASETDAANSLAKLGVIVDQSSNPAQYRLGSSITRREMLKVMMKLSSIQVEDACQGKFADLKASDWGCKYAETALANGFIAANPKFRPDDNISKWESLKFILKARWVSTDDSVTPFQKKYVDAAVTAGVLSSEFTDYNTAAARGWIFTSADNAISSTSASDSSDSSDDSSSDDSSTDDLGDDDLGLGDLFGDLGDDDDDSDVSEITSDDTASDDSSSDDAAADDTSSDDAAVDADDSSTEEDSTPATVVEGKNVEMALSPTTPASKSVAGTGSNIKVMVFDVTAGEEDVTLSALTVRRAGLGDNTSVSKLYVRDNSSSIITNQRGLSSDATARLVFRGGYTVKAGATSTLTLYANFVGATNKEYAFEITDASSLESSATVKWVFPLISNTIRGIDYTAQALTITAFSWVTDASNTDDIELIVGTTDQQIGRFNIGIDSTNKKDVAITSIRYKAWQIVKDYLDNIVLKSGSEAIKSTVSVDGKYVTFSFDGDGYVIPYGNTRTFNLYADVIGGDANDKIELYIDDTSDISAYELETNSSLQIVQKNESWTTITTKLYLKAYKIKEGENLIAKHSSSPVDAYVSDDANDVTLLVSSVSFKSSVYVETMTVTATTSAAQNGIIEEVNLLIDDQLIDNGTVDSATSTSPTYTFNVYKYLNGTVKFTVKADTLKNASNGATISSVTLGSSSFPNSTYEASSNALAASDINGSAVGSTFTIRQANLSSVTRSDSFADGDDAVKGVSDFKVGEFTFQSNNVKKLIITSIDVWLSSGSYAYINNVQLKKKWETTAIWTQDISSSTGTYSSLDLEIPVGWSLSLELYATIDQNHTTWTQNLQFNLGSFQIDQEDDNGNTTSLASPAITSVQSVAFDVIAWGQLTIAKLSDSTPADNVIDVSSSTEYEVARYDFKAEQDNIIIQELAFTGSAGAKAANAQFAIFKKVGSTETKVADYQSLSTYSSDKHYLTYSLSNAPITLEKNEDVTIIVKTKVNPTINTAAKTNTGISVTLTWSIAGTTAETNFVSETNSASISLTSALPITSNTLYVRKSKLKVAVKTANTSTFEFVASTDNNNQAAMKAFALEYQVQNDGSDSWNAADVQIKITKVEVGSSSSNLTDYSDSAKTMVITWASTFDAPSEVTSYSTVGATSGILKFASGGTVTNRAYIAFRGDANNSYTGWVTVDGAGTTFRVTYEITNKSSLDIVKVRIPELADSASTAALQYGSYYVTGSGWLTTNSDVVTIAWDPEAYSIVWSDYAESSLTWEKRVWFTDRRVVWIDAWNTLQ